MTRVNQRMVDQLSSKANRVTKQNDEMPTMTRYVILDWLVMPLKSEYYFVLFLRRELSTRNCPILLLLRPIESTCMAWCNGFKVRMLLPQLISEVKTVRFCFRRKS